MEYQEGVVQELQRLISNINHREDTEVVSILLDRKAQQLQEKTGKVFHQRVK